ncbi:hypothetical protein [Methylobacterium isbiliense]|jgi:hypothetical protein|uniref:Uncharacterized protein n=1 Tax=Methylobacterium isbiliense TaxID=315478 RepID=A0ABQ4SLM0_9HYPH|nr:hypothetical protein [Methylobacterium isbiliense]MDN3627609.1 hypothetical protein [Methylobacterium isbiliense]GJE03424.1 hypothetical protein GMJLKIPL_5379 [Methylobacterium isbiliense]
MSTTETHLTHVGPTNPPGLQPAAFEAWQALVAPGDVFRHPREVLAHPHLSGADKRAILASWASDACALENAPGLRCLTGSRAEPVSVDAVLATLAELDREAAPPMKNEPPRKRPRRPANLHRYVRSRRRDDDDDPPPCPAVAMPRPRMPSGSTALFRPIGTRWPPVELHFAAA